MPRMAVPSVHHQFRDYWSRHHTTLKRHYEARESSFVPNLLPEQSIQLSGEETVALLRQRFGAAFDLAISAEYTDPDELPSTIPPEILSPVTREPNGEWLKRTNMVGINVRTIHNFWNVVKYMFTWPAAQDSVHLLPIWEPGVVDSLYGMSSWQINDEFYSEELVAIFPYLNTVDRQLRAVVNLLHVMGKAVGMDVIPHTDRYSEMALANPHYFEWLQREAYTIVNHDDDLHVVVQERIMDFLADFGSAVADERVPSTREALFSEDQIDEARRLRILFGEPDDRSGRTARRSALVEYLYAYGFEPVPATMAPPFRDIQVDVSEDAVKVDEHGMVWRDYVITRPETMSRVFGPLARYKLYGRLNNNIDWEVDFEHPRPEVWDYICTHYSSVQQRFGFDFMRGDMSHVQMRPDGVPQEIDPYYDILGTVKNYIQRDTGVAYFGYFAETFLPPRDVFGYGEEIDHLEASDAETTLGDLQSMVVGSAEFMQNFRRYVDMLYTRLCVPNWTVMTGDKDDPRFDEFYVKGNELRLFVGYFLADMPSYVALGFQTRDVHYSPVPNEHYTKLFVFHETSGHKARSGDYIWGQNGALFHHLTRMKLYVDEYFEHLRQRPTRWLLPPDPTGYSKVIAWTQADGQPDFLFVANLDVDAPSAYFAVPMIPGLAPDVPLVLDFSTTSHVPPLDHELRFNGKHYKIQSLAAGEGRIYRPQRAG